MLLLLNEALRDACRRPASLPPTQCLCSRQLGAGGKWVTAARGRLFFFVLFVCFSLFPLKVIFIDGEDAASCCQTCERGRKYSHFLLFILSYEKASFFLRLVAIVMRGSGTTELNGEITNK